MPGTITVVNRHSFTPPSGGTTRSHTPYIGRGSAFGNPFVVGRGYARGEAVQAYNAEVRKAWRGEQNALPPDFIVALLHLIRLHRAGDDLYLVCSCAPNRCHGDTLKAVIEHLGRKADERQ